MMVHPTKSQKIVVTPYLYSEEVQPTVFINYFKFGIFCAVTPASHNLKLNGVTSVCF